MQDELIRKQAVLDKILKFSVTDGRSVSVSGLWTEVNDLPSVTPQEPCEDAVSRQAVIDEAFEVDTKEYGRIEVVGVDAINSLPPVTPQPKIGRWIDTNSKSFELHRVYKCSECGTTEIEYPESIYRHYRYCPNCGAKMQEVEE